MLAAEKGLQRIAALGSGPVRGGVDLEFVVEAAGLRGTAKARFLAPVRP